MLTQSMDSNDDMLSKTDENPDGNDRFEFESLDPQLVDICKAFQEVNFIPIDCPLRAHLDKETKGSPNIEMKENCLLSFFAFMSEEIGDLHSHKMLDVGSGYGMPSFVGNYVYRMSSIGVEISPLHVRTSLMMLKQYRAFVLGKKMPDPVDIYFIEKDLSNLISFNPYSIVYAASIG